MQNNISENIQFSVNETAYGESAGSNPALPNAVRHGPRAQGRQKTCPAGQAEAIQSGRSGSVSGGEGSTTVRHGLPSKAGDAAGSSATPDNTAVKPAWQAVQSLSTPLRDWAIGSAPGIGMMVMLMMPEVLCSRAGFVLAIAAGRNQKRLERQENEQENGKPAVHGQHSTEDR
jgi:hypothetical protein